DPLFRTAPIGPPLLPRYAQAYNRLQFRLAKLAKLQVRNQDGRRVLPSRVYTAAALEFYELRRLFTPARKPVWTITPCDARVRKVNAARLCSGMQRGGVREGGGGCDRVGRAGQLVLLGITTCKRDGGKSSKSLISDRGARSRLFQPQQLSGDCDESAA